MQASMVVMPQPASKGTLQMFTIGIAAKAVELFFIGLMASFHLSIESWGARWDQTMGGAEALAHESERMKFDGSV